MHTCMDGDSGVTIILPDRASMPIPIDPSPVRRHASGGQAFGSFRTSTVISTTREKTKQHTYTIVY
jgi:hypothetical protein